MFYKVVNDHNRSQRVKNKSRGHFLEDIFRPADSKSLRLRSAAFEMQLSHGVRGSPFKHPPIVSTKTVSSLLRGRTKMIAYIAGFLPNNVNANDRLCNLLQSNFT